MFVVGSACLLNRTENQSQTDRLCGFIIVVIGQQIMHLILRQYVHHKLQCDICNLSSTSSVASRFDSTENQYPTDIGLYPDIYAVGQECTYYKNSGRCL